jgi:hypothetical protein
MFKAIRGAGGGSNEVPKIRMKGVIVEGHEDIGTKAWGWTTLRVVLKQYSRGSRFERVEFLHPNGRFCKLVSHNVGNL